MKGTGYTLKAFIVAVMASALFWRGAGDKRASSSSSKIEQAEKPSDSPGDSTTRDTAKSPGPRSTRTVTYRYISEAEFRKLAGKKWAYEELQEDPAPQKKELPIAVPGTNKKRTALCYTLDGLVLCDSEATYYFIGYWFNPNTKQRYVAFGRGEPPLTDYPNFMPAQTYFLYYRNKKVAEIRFGGGTYVFSNLEGIYVSPDRRYMIFLGKTNMGPHASELQFLVYSIAADPVEMLWSGEEATPASPGGSDRSPLSSMGGIVGLDFWSTISDASAFIMEVESDEGERNYVLFQWK